MTKIEMDGKFKSFFFFNYDGGHCKNRKYFKGFSLSKFYSTERKILLILILAFHQLS